MHFAWASPKPQTAQIRRSDTIFGGAFVLANDLTGFTWHPTQETRRSLRNVVGFFSYHLPGFFYGSATIFWKAHFPHNCVVGLDSERFGDNNWRRRTCHWKISLFSIAPGRGRYASGMPMRWKMIPDCQIHIKGSTQGDEWHKRSVKVQFVSPVRTAGRGLE